MSTTASARNDQDADRQTGPSDCRLYLITPTAIELREFHGQLAEALDGGDVACVQLRLKDVSDDVILGAAEMLMPMVQERDIPFLINDRPDLAATAGADGVHIGQGDASYEEARSLVGPDGVVGITCHDSRHLAMIGGEKGADYVAFGAFFPTETKQVTTRADLDLIRWWRDATVVQCVAIGGITPENCGPIVSAGADFLAVSASVWNHPQGPGVAVRAFRDAIDRTPLDDPVI